MAWRFAGLLAFFWLQASWVMAEVVSGAEPARTSAFVYKEPLNSGSITQLMTGLIIVVGLIFLLAWFLRRYSSLPGQSRAMTVVASLPLSAREKIVLVQAGDKQLLLGVAPGSVNLLASYDPPLIQAGEKGDFALKLQQALSRVRPND